MKSPATPAETAAARPLIEAARPLAVRADDARVTAHFRPPALPTPQSVHGELPFTAHLGPRLRTRN